MKYKLIAPINNSLNAKQQVLINRGLEAYELTHYMNLTEADVNDPEALGSTEMYNADNILSGIYEQRGKIAVLVDCDCDGYTSAAVMINYIADYVNDAEYIKNNIFWFHHDSKQHGLLDAMEWIKKVSPDLLIIPDAGSNDIQLLTELTMNGMNIIILDHHEVEGDNEKADVYKYMYDGKCILINSQIRQYPNKELSGVGVVYQFCRFIDKQHGLNYADKYLDLVALGLTGDMMSLRSFETRYLISKGLKPENIHNPFMYEMWQKSKFKLGDYPTSWGVTFYIVPFVNAITRSGTQEEKELIFKSMLKHEAFNIVPSTKRGHKAGETERIVDQAVRTCTNVKNRQGRAEEAGLELIEGLIQKNNMMDHKVLLFLLEPGAIKPEIRGLIANKIMAKYQRPCCILTETKREITEKIVMETIEGSDGIGVTITNPIKLNKPMIVTTYEGSARGCDKVGVTEFKDICAATEACEYTVGHQGAFGLGIRKDNVQKFIESTDKQLANMSSEPVYYVDYIWQAPSANAEKILEIAELDGLWGKDMDEALVAVEEIKVTKNNITMMASNTVKITLPNGISMIKFRMPDEEYKKLYSEHGKVTINAVCRCNKNEWNGNISAQLLLEDYEIINKCAYEF